MRSLAESVTFEPTDDGTAVRIEVHRQRSANRVRESEVWTAPAGVIGWQRQRHWCLSSDRNCCNMIATSLPSAGGASL